MRYPVKVLQVVATMNMGGIENFLMNLYKSIDREKVQFDFLILNNENNIFEKEIEELGGKVFKIESIKKAGYSKFLKNLKYFFKEKTEYKVIHSHYNIMNGIVLYSSLNNMANVRISHSHSTSTGFSLLKNIFLYFSRILLEKSQAKKFACSNAAGIWLYGKNSDFNIIYNGIDASRYKYNYVIRENKREELQLSKKDIIVGHIGSFRKVKNHDFIIEIFSELSKKDKNYKLILVGDGELKKEIELKVDKKELRKNIIFLGIRKDIAELLQLFDIFLFPSLYEGLPISLVEAQTSGLKCFISENITKEIDLGLDLLEFISLKKSALEWANIIEEKKNYIRRSRLEVIQEKGYDIKKTSKDLVEVYLGAGNV
jgi:capsular polysaccharide biosynthesis proteinCps4H